MEQLIVAAELTQQANDLQQLGPMLDATAATLAAAGVQARPGMVLADSGYWTIANLTQIPCAEVRRWRDACWTWWTACRARCGAAKSSRRARCGTPTR
jgi:hypothetical protein